MAQDLKAVYSVSELARLAGVSRHRMRRLLAKGKVDKLEFGERKKSEVPLDSLRNALPAVWNSILTKQTFDR